MTTAEASYEHWITLGERYVSTKQRYVALFEQSTELAKLNRDTIRSASQVRETQRLLKETARSSPAFRRHETALIEATAALTRAREAFNALNGKGDGDVDEQFFTVRDELDRAEASLDEYATKHDHDIRVSLNGHPEREKRATWLQHCADYTDIRIAYADAEAKYVETKDLAERAAFEVECLDAQLEEVRRQVEFEDFPKGEDESTLGVAIEAVGDDLADSRREQKNTEADLQKARRERGRLRVKHNDVVRTVKDFHEQNFDALGIVDSAQVQLCEIEPDD